MHALKKMVWDAINHKTVERIPMMYRGEPLLDHKMIRFFGLEDITSDWQVLVENIGADFYSGGVSLCDFYTYKPKYIGPDFESDHDPNFFYIWGIKSRFIEEDGIYKSIDYFSDPPLKNIDRITDLKKTHFPSPDWFDFNYYTEIYKQAASDDYYHASNINAVEKYFTGACSVNNLFMISSYMRGMDRLLTDLAFNQKFASYLIDNIGEMCIEFCRRNLSSIGKKIDIYGMWDDIAMQNNLIMSPEMWRRFYKPWDKKITEEAKKYDLKVMFHCCGSCFDIIDDLIEIGIDILEPVQTSARNMEIDRLKAVFGNKICLHGGLDIQNLITQKTPGDIQDEVRRIKRLFSGEGGIILGPAHYLTADTPVENVLAIYHD